MKTLRSKFGLLVAVTLVFWAANKIENVIWDFAPRLAGGAVSLIRAAAGQPTGFTSGELMVLTSTTTLQRKISNWPWGSTQPE